MRRVILSVFLCAATSMMLGCGGGGGGGDDGGGSGNFPGLWIIDGVFVTDTCGLGSSFIGASQYMTWGYLVNQDGNIIAIQNTTSGSSGTGSTVDDGSGFVATIPEGGIGCPGGSSVTAVVLENVSGDEADATVGVRLSCPTENPPTCDFEWVGVANRR